MSQLPQISSRRLYRVIKAHGWQFSGYSRHAKFYHPVKQRYAVLTTHARTSYGGPLLRDILKDFDLSPEDL